MLRLIFTQDPSLCDSVIRSLGLIKKEESNEDITAYQKQGWILIFSPNKSFPLLYTTLLDLYIPDRIYLPYLGRSIDLIREVGDVVLPNVFFSYDSAIE
jgi:hypothetical protein